MAGNLFDVFVVGSTDPSAAGETRLAAALSAKHGIPLATVAKAISAKNLRAGQSLEQVQAQALVRHLQSIGAVTVIRPVGARPQGHAGSPSAQAPRPAPQAMASPAQPAPMSGRTLLAAGAPAGGWPGGPSALPGEPAPLPPHPQFVPMGGGGKPPAGAASPADPFAPPLASTPVSPAHPDPFQAKRVPSPIAETSIRPRQGGTPAPPGYARPSASGLAVDVSPGPRLELARGDRGGSDDDLSSARSRAGGSAASLREMGMTGTSGVAMDEDPRNLNLVRCVQHGLYYDKSKASGCRKCMSPAREVASKMAADAAVLRVGNLRGKPAKRAFIGLLLALVLGFLPAVYYCFGPGAAEARKFRVEQELLSRQPGTEEIMRRFDELDAQVIVSHNQSSRNTAIVWFAVASVAMLGWYKVT